MKCLLIIDVQNDFLPGGALAVPQGDEVVAVANRAMDQFDLVVATQDWHPADHQSFASQHPDKEPGEVVELNGYSQILWPDHCIQDSTGADFAPGLCCERIDQRVRKGTDREIDSYSGFFDNHRQKQTALDAFLRARHVDEVHLTGLATDYCVKYTALDARDLGFRTFVIVEGVRGIDLNAGDCDRAIDEMRARGVELRSL